jgi:hypothetical protein
VEATGLVVVAVLLLLMLLMLLMLLVQVNVQSSIQLAAAQLSAPQVAAVGLPACQTVPSQACRCS